MLSNHLILCRPLLPPSIFPSIRVFSNESVLRILWPKYWSFSFSISPCNEYSGPISFRMDGFDLLGIPGDPVKMQLVILRVQRMAWNRAFAARSQVLLVLPGPGPHFEQQGSGCSFPPVGRMLSVGFTLHRQTEEEGMATHSSILALENPNGQTSLVGYSPLGCQDTTEWLSTA